MGDLVYYTVVLLLKYDVLVKIIYLFDGLVTGWALLGDGLKNSNIFHLVRGNCCSALLMKKYTPSEFLIPATSHQLH